MSRLSRELNRRASTVYADEGNWLFGVPGIVADNQDPEKQHRVKVVIPSIDGELVFDEWARQLVFCLGDGFGSAFVPPRDSEVVLFGQLGQKFNLFYASVYNEEMRLPATLEDENNVGLKVPGNLSLLVALLAKITGQNIESLAEQLHKTTGQNIESLATQLNKMTGTTIDAIASGQAKFKGGTVRIESDGTIVITSQANMTVSSSGNIAVSASGTLTLENRPVNKSGPPI